MTKVDPVDTTISNELKTRPIPDPLPANAVIAVVADWCEYCHALIKQTMKPDGKFAETTKDGRPIVYVNWAAHDVPGQQAGAFNNPATYAFYQKNHLDNLKGFPTLLATDDQGNIVTDGVGNSKIIADDLGTALKELNKPSIPEHVQKLSAAAAHPGVAPHPNASIETPRLASLAQPRQLG